LAAFISVSHLILFSITPSFHETYSIIIVMIWGNGKGGMAKGIEHGAESSEKREAGMMFNPISIEQLFI